MGCHLPTDGIMVWTYTLQQHGAGVKSEENHNKAERLQLFTVSNPYGYTGKNRKRHSCNSFDSRDFFLSFFFFEFK